MSRFVSAGTDEAPNERDEAWQKAQTELDARRQEKLEVGKQEGGKSLYETLQANKAAKQEAFEESVRLKNQFRSLDEDEVEFLDSVLESTRSKEAEVKKETQQQLDVFRKQQEDAEKTEHEQDDPGVLPNEVWKASIRKRKKGRETAIGGVKLRRMSTAEKETTDPNLSPASRTSDLSKTAASQPNENGKLVASSSEGTTSTKMHTLSTESQKPVASSSGGLGLAAYSSDEAD